MNGCDDIPLRLTTPDGGVPRVLYVGASAVQATVAVMLIDQFGCRPRHAASGEAALAHLRGEDDADLLVIDIDLPDMDGLVAVQLARTLAARDGLPVIALADQSRADIAGRAAGLCGVLAKPYSPRELFAAMQKALGIPALAEEFA